MDLTNRSLNVVCFLAGNAFFVIIALLVSVARKTYENLYLMVLPSPTELFLRWHWVIAVLSNIMLLLGVIKSREVGRQQTSSNITILTLFTLIIYLSLSLLCLALPFIPRGSPHF